MNIPIPKTWPKHVRTGILHAISLARMALVAARGRAARSRKARVRLASDLAEAHREIALLEEELRLKDLRMERVPARHRPYCRPVERLAILELRAARGWSRRQTARRFLLKTATISSWMTCIDEDGAQSLLETPEPVNRLPDFIRHIVQRLKVLCPTMGKKRIAQTLARAGLMLGVSTVARMLKERERPEPEGAATAEDAPGRRGGGKPVKAEKPNDVWQLDLTLVPTAVGFWTAWFPFSLPQLWPFCWWVACVVDHCSRRVMCFEVYPKEPKSINVQRLLVRVSTEVGATPRYVVTDKGRQFDCGGFRAWCRRRGIRARYASTDNIRATAIVERFIRSLKDEWLRRIVVPLRADAMRHELRLYQEWFAAHRPHQGLEGRTPGEVYDGMRGTPPERATLDGEHPLSLVVHFHEGRGQLPIVELKRAA